MGWLCKWFAKLYGYDKVIEEHAELAIRFITAADRYQEELQANKNHLVRLHTVSLEDPPTECNKIKHYGIESATLHKERLEKRTKEEFTIYECTVCPRHKITEKPFLHVAHAVPAIKRLKAKFND